MLKQIVTRIATLYAANGKFHALVHALEMSTVGFLVSWNGGFPKTKVALIVLIAAFGGALWGAIKGWMRENAALASVQGRPANPAQAVSVAAVKDRLAEAAAAAVTLPGVPK